MREAEEFWEELLARIEAGQVIPVVGPELLTVLAEGRETPLYRVLAERLLAKYGLVASATAPECEPAANGALVAWFDKSDLKPGDPWEQAIRNAVNGCYLFLPLVSANTEAREEGFFREEWTLASERARRIQGRKFIVPIVVDRDYDSNAGRFLLVPERFFTTHFGQAPEGDLSEDIRNELTRLIRERRSQRPA